MPLRGTGPPPGHRSAATAHGSAPPGVRVGRYGASVRLAGAYGDRGAEATGGGKERRCNVKRIPVALKRWAIIIFPSGAQIRPPKVRVGRYGAQARPAGAYGDRRAEATGDGKAKRGNGKQTPLETER
jgi:hypothetical protein